MTNDAVDSVPHKTRSTLAIASGILALVGWFIVLVEILLVAVLGLYRVGRLAPLGFALLLCVVSIILGICALVSIRRKHLRGNVLAVSAIVASLLPFFYIALMFWGCSLEEVPNIDDVEYVEIGNEFRVEEKNKCINSSEVVLFAPQMAPK
jgi:hypothetical protein